MWVRALEIILGLIVLVLGVYLVIYPGVAALTLGYLLGIALIVIAIRDFVTVFGRGVAGWQRAVNLILAIIALILGVYVLAYPLGGIFAVAFLVGFALILLGIAAASRGTGLGIAAGIIALILGFVVVIYPGLGVALAIILLSVAFILLGLEAIAAGIAGKTIGKPGMQWV
jgi:uncharacterized membrane protein HdeD (DUF308 family)